MEMLLGKSYGEWIEILRPDTLRSDSPLIQHDEKWRVVARGEAWSFLGNKITDGDLERFQRTAVSVLGERDPKFDFPKEERFAAGIHGKVLTHSRLLRVGIAETLALIGSRPEALASCSYGKADSVAVLIVRELLNKASWDRWASLDPITPLLAEASPVEFLDAVESVLVDLKNTPFHKIFAEEGGGGFDGWNYMSGLLWALETLAWSPEFLSRVSIILAEIASFDPGGNWANRPFNSLVDIYLPWHVQTIAPFEKRKSAVEAVVREQPDVGWMLLLALLPNDHTFTSGCNRPVWRDFIPRDWKEDTLKTEYWAQVNAYTDLAITLAKSDLGKLCEIIKRLPDLANKAHESLLNHLTSDQVVLLPEVDRMTLWESLDELIRKHRKHFSAEWALSKAAIDRIEKTAKALTPITPEYKYRHLFGGRDLDLYDDNGNYNDKMMRLDETRQAAISEIIADGNVNAALQFATKVDAPYEVGRALGEIASDEMEGLILPSLLDSEDDTSVRVVAGFIWARFWKLKIEWVDAVLERIWSPEHQAKFLTLLPFEEEIWLRVSRCLMGTHEALYWKNVKVNPYGPDRELTVAIEKLLEHGRGGAAVMCVVRTADSKSRFNESLATQALLSVLDNEDGMKELNKDDTVELITRLQKSETTNKDDLFRIEWNFLHWLDRFSTGSPVTLEKELASDPAFFAEVIRLVYRSKKDIKDDCVEPDKNKKNLAQNAYKLLTEWTRCPGKQDDGSFSAEAFKEWLMEARKLTEESGHAEVAQIQIGHVLTYIPPDPGGLWIHKAVAEALNFRETSEMRSGYTIQLFNNRGIFSFTHGQTERKIASEYREKADALDLEGYTRFASAMRELAEQYEHQAKHDANRDPIED